MLAIRRAEENDLPLILELYSQIENDGRMLSQGAAREIFAKINAYPDYSIYVAEADGQIAGTFSLAVMDNLAHMGKKSGLVEDVVVTAKLRGQGVGRTMMREAMRICREKDCYKICLFSNLSREAAHRFYEKLGFTKHGYSFLIETGQPGENNS